MWQDSDTALTFFMASWEGHHSNPLLLYFFFLTGVFSWWNLAWLLPRVIVSDLLLFLSFDLYHCFLAILLPLRLVARPRSSLLKAISNNIDAQGDVLSPMSKWKFPGTDAVLNILGPRTLPPPSVMWVLTLFVLF